jgi:hypothetical protein
MQRELPWKCSYCFDAGFVRFTLIALSIASSATRIAIARLSAVPDFGLLPGIKMVHFQPVGLAVWTTLYGIPLRSM